MTLPDVPTESHEAAGPAPAFTPPPSLMRRNPARIDFSDDRGKFPAPRRAGLHLRSGTHYTVRVWLHPPEDGGNETPCRVEPGPALRCLFSFPESQSCKGEYYVVVEPRNLTPLPLKTELTVFVHDQQRAPHSLALPVVVWPALTTRFCWVAAVVLTLVGARFKSLWEGKDGTALATVRQLAMDGLLWLEMAGVFFAGMVGLTIVGLLSAAYGPRRR